MKVISNRIVQVQEVNEALRIPGLKLSVSIIRPSSQCAQVVVCESSNTFTNMVCVMNMPSTIDGGKNNCTSSLLVDDASSGINQQNEMMKEEESSLVADLAKMLGEKICKKTGLTQLFFSLNIDFGTAKNFSQDFNLMMTTEKRVTDLIKSLD